MAYRIVRFLLRFVIRLFADVIVIGYENLPVSGPFVIAGNHLGRLDPLLVYVVLNRKDVIVIVAEKYSKSAVLRWFFHQFDAIFIDRFGADFSTLRVVLNRLKKGQVLVVAPEGTRSQSEALIEGWPGAVYLAAKAGVPIVPASLLGTEDRLVKQQLLHLHRLKITIRIGKPITFPPLPAQDRDVVIQQYTDEIMCRIATLLPPSHWGVYANHPRLKELLSEESDEKEVVHGF